MMLVNASSICLYPCMPYESTLSLFPYATKNAEKVGNGDCLCIHW